MRTVIFVLGWAAAACGAEECAGCHRAIWESYQKTGMGRSFYRPTAENAMPGASYYHAASESYFTMVRRGEEYFQQRYQLGPDGARVNVMEKRIDAVLGSGNHSRAYLHRTGQGKLVELPLAWYAEKGGYWGMNPGYDRADHDGFRREIGYDCLFCHNAYPKIPAGSEQPFAEPVYVGALPEGIDCARCHGDGARHVAAARRVGTKREEIRGAIVNPARLSGERQMEVCMQCHLESTSFALPNAIQRYERGAFSYRAGERLADFLLNFDHAKGSGREDKFEIVNAAYRLRRSACFLKSEGKLGCTTCHNPHDIPRGEEAARHYTDVCRQCHAGDFQKLVAEGKHVAGDGCAECHMPKRRTEDVVHVVVTDHYIQRRRPAGDLLAERAERRETEASAYHGEVAPYYPEKLTGRDELYGALAQVIQKSNLAAGIERLREAIERWRPERAEYYLELAEALKDKGELAKAVPLYEEAVRRNPRFVYGEQRLGAALRRLGRYVEAEGVLRRAAEQAPESAGTWRELGLAYQAAGKREEAVAALERALALEPDMAEARNNLGVIWMANGEGERAEAAFREAIRTKTEYGDARGNLGNLLAGKGDLAGAAREFEAALRLKPEDGETRYGYAMALGRMRKYDEAQRELEEALRGGDGRRWRVDAELVLGDLLMAKGLAREAVGHYREAVKAQPEMGRARLGLGVALVSAGDRDGALEHLRKAAGDADVGVREEAGRVLKGLGK